MIERVNLNRDSHKQDCSAPHRISLEVAASKGGGADIHLGEGAACLQQPIPRGDVTAFEICHCPVRIVLDEVFPRRAVRPDGCQGAADLLL